MSDGSSTPADGDPRVVLFNPLPQAFEHFTRATRENLSDAGIATRTITVNLELGSRGRWGKLLLLASAALPLLRAARTRQTVVVLWPIFGLLDIVFWRVFSPRRSRRLVIVHDPIPLRRQLGYGPRAARLAARASRDQRVEVVAHTQLAAEALENQGLLVRHVLPHPVLKVALPERAPSQVLLVAGQYKESRDLSFLSDLGRADHSPWDLQIVGRGWPAIEGWAVDARFVPEEELDARLASAAAVLIPYSHYFQSGIATRCCELSVPVVARRHEFIESLYGADWPGIVDADTVEGWLQAVSRATTLGASPERAIAEAARAWGGVIRGSVDEEDAHGRSA